MRLMGGRHSDPGISVNSHHGWHSLGLLHVTLTHMYEPGITFTHESMRDLSHIS